MRAADVVHTKSYPDGRQYSIRLACDMNTNGYYISGHSGVAGVDSNQDLTWCVKNRGICGFLGPS